MATVSIKNVPDEVIRRLKERAKLNHRSMQGEALSILEDATRPKFTPEELAIRVRELGVRTESDSTEIIREIRDAR